MYETVDSTGHLRRGHLREQYNGPAARLLPAEFGDSRRHGWRLPPSGGGAFLSARVSERDLLLDRLLTCLLPIAGLPSPGAKQHAGHATAVLHLRLSRVLPALSMNQLSHAHRGPSQPS